MPTMTHTDEQRKAWHAGKRREYETVSAWFSRVLVKAENFRGAYTPARLKRGIFYKTLD